MSVSPRFLVDEDFDNDILRGVLRRMPGLDVVRVQDVDLRTKDDATVLRWAAAQGRILLTHDVATMTTHAINRIEASQPMPGLFAVSQLAPIGQVIDDLVLIAECSTGPEWDSQIHYLPLP